VLGVLRSSPPPSDNTVSQTLRQELLRPSDAHHINVLFPSGRSNKSEQSNVIDEGGIVEVWVDLNVRDVKLLVWERFGRRRDIILAKSDLEDLLDARNKGEAANVKS